MLDNANPTILSVSDLPTRRQRRQRKEYAIPGGIEEMFFSKPTYEMNPYYTLEYSDADSEDSNIEPIDEQEIYGKSIYLRLAYPSNLPMYSVLAYFPDSSHWPGSSMMSSISIPLPDIFVSKLCVG
jgi:hypothetical protein